MEKKRKNTFSPPKRMIIIGIYEDPNKGILIVRNNNGGYQLPGGKIWRRTKPSQAQKQIQAEYNKITKIVFEKCGLSLDVQNFMGLYNIKESTSKKFKLIKVVILKQNFKPANKNWERLIQFDADFMPADLEIIKEYYPKLPLTDWHILKEYFTLRNITLNNEDKNNELSYPLPLKIIA